MRSSLLPIFLIVLVDILGFTLIVPLLPFYAERMGATPFSAAMLVTVFSLCQLLSSPILGHWSDQMGRKPVLLLSQFGTLLSFLMLAYSKSLTGVFLARILDGITAGNISIAQAYISDVTNPKDRARGFGLIGAAFGIGFLLGPALSGLIAEKDFSAPIFVAAGLSLASIFATLVLLPEKTRKEKRKHSFKWLDLALVRESFKVKPLREVLIQYLLFSIGIALFSTNFALFSERRFSWEGVAFGPREVGILFSYIGLLNLLIQGVFIGKLVKNHGEERLAAWGFLLNGIGCAAIALSHSLIPLFISITIYSLGSSCIRPALTSLISQRAESAKSDIQGVVMGLSQSLVSFAHIFAPLLGGFLIERGSLTFWGILAGFIIASSLTLGRSWRNLK